MSNFRSTLLESAIESHNQGTLSRIDLIRLRFATLNPSVLKQIQDVCAEQYMTDTKATSIEGIDWKAFLKEILPIILPIILKLLGL